MPGAAYNSIQNPRMYERLRKLGYSKRAAARISNARTPGRTVKAGYDAGVGQQIAGNLYRGAGGKFTGGSGGNLTPAQQRARQAAQERDAYGQNEDAIRQREDAAVEAEPNRTKRAALRRQVVQARRARLYARRAARRQMAEQERLVRDQERAQRNEQIAQNRARRAAEVAARREQVAARRQAAAEARARARGEKPPKAPKPPKPAKPTAAERRAQARERVVAQMMANDTGITRVGAEGLDALAGGGVIEARAADQLMAMGLAERGANGRVRLTVQGRIANNAISRGDYGRALEAIDKAAEALAKRQPPKDEEAPPAKPAPAPRKRPTPGTPKRRQRPPGDRTGPATKAFVVYKDAKGRDRWAAVTSSAYIDRDGEIITRKGLAHMVAYGDRTGERGTLRYWHVPGFDLGDCDFQTVSDDGLFLIESGTFRSPAAAAAGRRLAAKGWTMSPGFLHPASEPYPAIVGGRRVGLYDHPMAFERSLCPPGRASNLYTRFVTKERGMSIPADKLEEARKALGPDLLEALLTEQATQKAAADADAAVYKDAPPWAQALIARLDALEATKAAMPPEEMLEAAATETEDAEVEEMAAEDEVPEPGDFVGDLSRADFIALMQEVLSPLLGSLDIEKKMRGYVDEMKGLLSPALAQKDDALAAIDARLKAVEGDLPLAATQRASIDPATALPPEQAAALKAAPYAVGEAAKQKSAPPQNPTELGAQFVSLFPNLNHIIGGS